MELVQRTTRKIYTLLCRNSSKNYFCKIRVTEFSVASYNFGIFTVKLMTDIWLQPIFNINVVTNALKHFFWVLFTQTLEFKQCSWCVISGFRRDANEICVLRINNQQGASSIQNFILSRNSTCFGRLLCPSLGVISCTRGNWYVSCRLCGRCLGESGCSIVIRSNDSEKKGTDVVMRSRETLDSLTTTNGLSFVISVLKMPKCCWLPNT